MEPVLIEFVSEGACVRGRFFPTSSTAESTTLLFVPGWGVDDDLGLGPLLSEKGINFFTFNPRGVHTSDGIHTHPGTLQDITAALQWLRQAQVQIRFKVNPARLVLGGYSYGGGMAMAYAARGNSVRRVISVAGTDHGEFARELQRNQTFAQEFRRWLLSTRAPEGWVRFDLETNIQELFDHPDIYGLRENAAKLADRSLLIFGGWEDMEPTIDQYLLPLYRALRNAGSEHVTFLVYHTDHSFGNLRQRLASDIVEWLLREWSG